MNKSKGEQQLETLKQLHSLYMELRARGDTSTPSPQVLMSQGLIEFPMIPVESPRKTTSKYGKVNDVDFMVSFNMDGVCYMHPSFIRWNQLWNRCTTSKKAYTSTVCNEWKSFREYLKWDLPQVEEFRRLHIFESLRCDKDCLGGDNRHYSPNTCILVTSKINNLLKVGKGVYRRPSGSYYSSCHDIYGNKNRIGPFTNQVDTRIAYLETKSQVIFRYSKVVLPKKVQEALRSYSEILQMKAQDLKAPSPVHTV